MAVLIGHSIPVRWRDLPRCPFFGNKICHPDRASAVDHADFLTRRNSRRGNPAKATVRRCHICDTLHVGHRRKQRKH
jgi:hypothetical protein